MRGVSGAGKSTEAARLGRGGAVIGSDSFFMQNGVYHFDQKLLPQAHQSCINRVSEAMQQDVSPIVCDNTNLERWESKPYVELADRYGYQVRIAEPQTPWRLDVDELTRRNRHGVTRERIQEMVNAYHQNNPFTADTVRNSRKPEPIQPQAFAWYDRYLTSDGRALSYFS